MASLTHFILYCHAQCVNCQSNYSSIVNTQTLQFFQELGAVLDLCRQREAGVLQSNTSTASVSAWVTELGCRSGQEGGAKTLGCCLKVVRELA